MVLNKIKQYVTRIAGINTGEDPMISGSNFVLEQLEKRELLSASLDAGVLTLFGSAESDRITIKPGGDDGVIVVTGDPDGDNGTYEGVDSVIVDGGEGNDQIKAKGNLTDTAGNNLNLTLIGGPGNDRLVGGPGDDTLIGDEGRDKINGRNGNDSIDGGAGNDRLNGGKGDDDIDGDSGNDRIQGSDGNDTIDGGNGDDQVLGGRNDDVITGGQGVDRLNGQRGTDTVSYESSPAGVDISLAEHRASKDGFGTSDRKIMGFENVNGSVFDDIIEGDHLDNILDGVAGTDQLLGGNGDDTLIEHNAPALDARLANDDSANDMDGLTTDPTVTGTVTDFSTIVSFRVGFDEVDPADFIDILTDLQPDGSFLLEEARLEEINGAPLTNERHTLHLIAEDEWENVTDTFELEFTLLGPGTVKTHQKISDTAGGFTGTLDIDDGFGNEITVLGDLDGDGVEDLAVGAPSDDDAGSNRGAVWILFLNPDGTVKAHQKISDTEGGFSGTLDNVDHFGVGVANLGDLDGDGVQDLAVGAPFDDDGGSGRGAVWVLFLNPDGTVKGHQKISDTTGGFTGILDNDDAFGYEITAIGDLDGDGVEDLAVGAHHDDDGGFNHGAMYILFLNPDGTVKGHQKISDTQGGFTGTLSNVDQFGVAAANLGDLDGDGVQDLVVGSALDDDGGINRGAVWILFLNPDGTVKAHQKISDTEGGFTGTLGTRHRGANFGVSVANIGDLNGDGVEDIAVGAIRDNDGGSSKGAVWILFLNPDGTVKEHQKISDTVGGFTSVLNKADAFGFAVAKLGDLDGDGVADLAVGAGNDDDGGIDQGAVWILFLNGP